MFSTVLQLQAKNILELGVLFGESTLSLLLGAFVTGGEVHSVDIQRPFFEPPTLVEEKWHFHHAFSLAYLRSLPADVYLDLVWLDDLHDYEHVKEEIRLLAPHLHSSSIVLLHDTMMGHPGVGLSELFRRDGDGSVIINEDDLSSAPYHYLETQIDWDSFERTFNSTDFKNGGPYHALLDLPREAWEWATVPTCCGMTLLRMKSGAPPLPKWQRRLGPDGYYR
jgi:hypothetical protein